MRISVDAQLKGSRSDDLLIPVRQDENLAANLAGLAKLFGCPADVMQSEFKADLKEVLPFFPGRLAGPGRVYLLGLGKEVRLADTIAAARSFAHKNKSKLGPSLEVDLRQFVDNEPVVLLAEAIANGLELGLYDISLYKTEAKKPVAMLADEAEVRFFVPENSVGEAERAARRGQLFGETQKRMFDLLNAPGNKKLPVDLANWAVESGRRHGFSTKVFLRKECEEAGLRALLSVNDGSANDPAFIIMEYLPTDPRAKVGLVGKGVTFDTGGISIKPNENMHLMKSDMGGAAAVFGAVEMAAKLRLPVHLVGIVPSTENMVDGRATKPGDVVSSYSGKTIEVIDTDAEGRIILADGLNYMVKNFSPETLLDLATLTGSVVRTLGSQAAGLFSQNDSLCEKLIAAGERTGERLWRLPMWDSFADTIQSDVADVKNYSGRPVHDASNAAKFLEVFTEKHPAWAHLDIAGVAMTAGEFSTDRSATAFGVRLLTTFVESLLAERTAV